MKTDIQISQENKMEEIQKIADKLKIEKEVLEPYGRYMAKLDVEKIQDRNKKRKGVKHGKQKKTEQTLSEALINRKEVDK